MRIHIPRILQALLIVLLVVPASLLFSVDQNPVPRPNLSVPHWATTQQAENLLDNMQTLAFRIRKEIGPIQIISLHLDWQAQASKLASVRSRVNEIGNNLLHPDQMKAKLAKLERQLSQANS